MRHNRDLLMLGSKWYVLLDLVRTRWDSKTLVWIMNGTLVLHNIGVCVSVLKWNEA